MKINEIKSPEDVKKYCSRHDILCPDDIAEKILICILYEKYPIELTEDDVVLQLFDYFAKGKSNDKPEKQMTPKKGAKEILKKFAQYLISPIEPKEIKIITVDDLYEYILKEYNIELTDYELKQLYNILIDMGLNDKYNKIHNKLSIEVDNFIVEKLVRETIAKYRNRQDQINFMELEDFITYMKKCFFAKELLENSFYESTILEEYKNRTRKPINKTLFESTPKKENSIYPDSKNFENPIEEPTKPKKH